MTYVKTTEGKVNGPIAVNLWRHLIRCGRVASDHRSAVTECVVGLCCCRNVLETWVARVLTDTEDVWILAGNTGAAG